MQGPRCQYSYVGSVAAVELAGGMVRIKDHRFSPSTIDYDLHFDKWLTISDVQDADKVTANVPVTPVSFFPVRPTGQGSLCVGLQGNLRGWWSWRFQVTRRAVVSRVLRVQRRCDS